MNNRVHNPVIDRKSLESEAKRLNERLVEQPDGRLFAPLADCYRKLGELDKALNLCLSGLARYPEYSSAHVILGKIHLARGDDSSAREAFSTVLEFDSQNLLALRQLAQLEETLGDLESAIERWEQVCGLELDPESAEEHLEGLRSRLQEAAEDPVAEVDGVAEVDEVGAAVEAESAAPAAELVDVDEIDDVEEGFEQPEADPDPEPEPDSEPDPEPEAVAVDVPSEPEPAEPPRVEEQVPTTEIATMTLAEIYAEQGFKEKALEIYQQIQQRHPDSKAVAGRITALESTLEASTSGAQAWSAGLEAAPSSGQASSSEVDRSQEEVTVEAMHSEAEVSEVSLSPGPEVSPSPPIEAPTSPEVENRAEDDRFNHFRSWLDRIRVDD